LAALAPRPSTPTTPVETWLGPNFNDPQVNLPSTASLPPPGASTRTMDAFSPIDITIVLPHSVHRTREEEEDLIKRMRDELAADDAVTRESEKLDERMKRLSDGDDDWVGPSDSKFQMPPSIGSGD